ncbi:MAG: hypothetical protein AAF633_02225 [Chloroflexota bacterium]
MGFERLKSGSVEAWTYLIRSNNRLINETVVYVADEEVDDRTTRYHLSLAGQSEPITLLLRESNSSEIAFYQQFASAVAHLTPRCWIAQEDEYGQNGCLILDDSENHHPPATWSKTDLVRLMGHLAYLHARYWNQGVLLSSYLRPHPIYQEDLTAGIIDGFKFGSREMLFFPLTSEEEAQSKAIFKAKFRSPSRIISAMKRLQVDSMWSGVISDQHLEAISALLYEPEAIFDPLRSVPVTILHGQPIPINWSINLLDGVTLPDWHRVSAGPGILDVAALVEDFVVWNTIEPDAHAQVNGSLQELLLDSYFLALNARIRDFTGDSSRLSTRFLRRSAYPAAVCWHVLTYWIPKLLTNMELDQPLFDMHHPPQYDPRRETEVWVNDHYKIQLSATFNRFLDAYKLLKTSPVEVYD